MNYKVIFSPSARKIGFLKQNVENVSYDQSEHQYYVKGIKSEDDLKHITSLCKKHHIPYKKINLDYDRDTSYRRRFFDAYKSNNGKYFCAYCGRVIDSHQVTVDHITPVAAARKSKSTQRILNLFGIKNINCTKNLAPSCRECNSKKSANTGFWLIRGYLGKHKIVWITTHILSYSLLFCLNYLILSIFANYQPVY